MHKADAPSAMPVLTRSQRLALVGAFISALGLTASLPAISSLYGFWLIALLACLAYGWFALRQARSIDYPKPLQQPAQAQDAPRAGQALTSSGAAPANAHPVPAEFSVSPQSQEEGRFLSSAGHDLRQPLQAISLFSATLAAHALPAESARLVSGIEQAAEALSELFEAVMALARLAAGRVVLQQQIVSLGSLLTRTAGEHIELAQERGIHLRHVNTRLRVQADEEQLARALDCLLAHALATTTEGGILLGCRRREHQVHIEVWDNGSGLSSEDKAIMFEAFSDYGQSLKDRGLGLVLANRLVGMMGGVLRVKSFEGRGKLLAICLPYSPDLSS